MWEFGFVEYDWWLGDWLNRIVLFECEGYGKTNLWPNVKEKNKMNKMKTILLSPPHFSMLNH